jgi:hypothetical protein
VSRRLWRAYVQVGDLKERALRRLLPARLHFVHYSWPLRASVCPCDVHFCEFLAQRNIRHQSIFHFGTGGHHVVGLQNQRAALANEILGLTLSPREHASYVKRVIDDPALAKHYKVLFADIYSLSAACLPEFGLVTLFHLCEFTDPNNGGRRTTDAEVLRLFCSKLQSDGLMLFYPGSFGYARAAPLIEQAVTAGWLSFDQEYKSLIVYRAGRAAVTAHYCAPA